MTHLPGVPKADRYGEADVLWQESLPTQKGMAYIRLLQAPTHVDFTSDVLDGQRIRVQQENICDGKLGYQRRLPTIGPKEGVVIRKSSSSRVIRDSFRDS